MEKPSAQSLRMHNRFAVLRALLTEGVATRQQLTYSTGLSAATVSTIINDLQRSGLVAVESVHNTGLGRPQARLQVDPSGARVLGVDVAETYVHAVAYDLRLNRLGDHLLDVDERENGPDYVVDAIARSIRGVLTDLELEIADVDGIGVSMPGQVQPDVGVSVFAPNWNWHDVKIEQLLETELGRFVHVDNPLKAIALAELWFGVGRDGADLVTVNLGTGVGVGLTLDGQLLRGASNNAGEWGHTLLVFDGRPCHCGRNGCVEAYVGAAGIQATLAEIDPGHAALEISQQSDFIDAVRDGLQHGDRSMQELITRTGRYLAAALGDIINLTNTSRISMTGWTTHRIGDWLIPAMREALPGQALPSSLAAVEIEPSEIAGNIVALGMATLTLEDFLTGVGVSRTALR